VARTKLLSPGGPLAMQLAAHGVVLKVNDWLFAHGGVLPHHGQFNDVVIFLVICGLLCNFLYVTRVLSINDQLF